MKKVYEKPALYFDSFELSSSIALGCAKEVHTFAKNQCGIMLDANTIAFIDGISMCNYYPQDSDRNKICYDNPNDSQRLFNSQ